MKPRTIETKPGKVKRARRRERKAAREAKMQKGMHMGGMHTLTQAEWEAQERAEIAAADQRSYEEWQREQTAAVTVDMESGRVIEGTTTRQKPILTHGIGAAKRQGPYVPPPSPVASAGVSDPRQGVRDLFHGHYYGKQCYHSGFRPQFVLSGERTISGAARSDSRTVQADLIVDLTGLGASADSETKLPPGYEALGQFMRDAAPLISVDWPDAGLPPVTYAFWPTLYRLLPDGHTIVRCLGGHGRTGTALACLLVCSGLDAETAMAEVRKVHCEEAIETKSQEEYVVRFATWFADHGMKHLKEPEAE